MRRILERLRRLTVPRSVIGKLAELEARICAADTAFQEQNTHQQKLVLEHQALSARNELLRHNHQALKALYEALQAEHQALETRFQSLNSRYEEQQTYVHALRQDERRLIAQHQSLQQSQTALNAHCETLQSAYQMLEIAHHDLATRHQAQLMETQSSLKEWSERSHLTHRAQTAKIIRKILDRRNEPRQMNTSAAERNRKTIHEQHEALKAAFPHLFPIWDELFENARVEYEERPVGNLSVAGNRSSAAFGKFLSLYAHGSVLDVGCGIQELPSYLDDLVIDRLAGVDPLASPVERKFEFEMSAELGDGRTVEVIRNIPNLATKPTRDYEALKKQLGIADSKFVLLWQGGTGPTRLIEPIIEALAFAPDCTFVIRGPSLDIFGDGYRTVAARAGVGDRLILTPPVPSRDVVSAARGADLGVWTLPKLCRNFTFALPNKIFEYMAAGLPVIVADYAEARRLVEKYGVGLGFDPYDPRSIASAINHMIANKSFRNACADNSIRALDSLSGSNEGRKLAGIYDRLPRTTWWKRFAAI